MEKVAQKFVRLIGPRDECDALKPRLLEAGALAVKIEPVRSNAQVAEDEVVDPKRDETIREAAEAVVKATKFDDVPALSGFVDSVLSGVGL